MKIQLVDGLQEWVSALCQALEARGHSVAGLAGEGARVRNPKKGEELLLRLDLEPPGALLSRSAAARIVVGQVSLSVAPHAGGPREPSADGAGPGDGRPSFLVQEVLRQLNGLLRGAPAADETVVRIRDLEIDVGARRVCRGGREIALTRREFDLLEFLARHRGRVVSPARILEHLYKDTRGVRSNTIPVFIRYLRRKIDRDFDPPLIQTRWCQGYMLCDG